MKVRALGFVLVIFILFTGCKEEDSSVVLPHTIEQTVEGTITAQEAEPRLITMDDLEDVDAKQEDDSMRTADLQQTVEAPVQETVLFEESCHSSYAYESLSEAEKLWYRDINRTLGNLLEKQEPED